MNNDATWTSAEWVISNNSWSWPNGDVVNYGLASFPGFGPRLVIDTSDFKLHAANATSIAGPQCEAGEDERWWNTRSGDLQPLKPDNHTYLSNNNPGSHSVMGPPFNWHGSIGIRTWINDYIQNFPGDVFTHPCQNFSSVWAWMNNYIPDFSWLLSLTHVLILALVQATYASEKMSLQSYISWEIFQI